MNDYNAIQNLMHVYAEKFDLGDLEGTAAIFKRATIKWGPGAPFIDSDAMLALFKQNLIIYEDGTPKTHHLLTNPIIEIAEDGLTATSRCYYTVIQQTETLPFQMIAGGRYHDKLAKENGEWFITKRELLFDLMGDTSQHIRTS